MITGSNKFVAHATASFFYVQLHTSDYGNLPKLLSANTYDMGVKVLHAKRERHTGDCVHPTTTQTQPPQPPAASKPAPSNAATSPKPPPAPEQAGPKFMSDMVFAEIQNTVKAKPAEAKAVNSIYLFVIKLDGKPAKKWGM